MGLYMLPQLLKVTNAYDGRTIYIAQDKVVYFQEAPKAAHQRFKHEAKTMIAFGSGENDYYLIADPIEKILDRFPPV